MKLNGKSNLCSWLHATYKMTFLVISCVLFSSKFVLFWHRKEKKRYEERKKSGNMRVNWCLKYRVELIGNLFFSTGKSHLRTRCTHIIVRYVHDDLGHPKKLQGNLLKIENQELKICLYIWWRVEFYFLKEALASIVQRSVEFLWTLIYSSFTSIYWDSRFWWLNLMLGIFYKTRWSIKLLSGYLVLSLDFGITHEVFI